MDNYNLRPVWDGILDIYKEIAKICERHGLRYYFTGGNCLGAVRHKGFIPWDDDLDIFLPWEDYDKFWKYAKDELPSYYLDVGWWNTPGYSHIYCKIQDSRRDVVRRIEKLSGMKLPQGLFVDVFPLVNAPYCFWNRIWWNVEKILLRITASYRLRRQPRPGLKAKIIRNFGWLVAWLFPSVRDVQTLMAVHEARARRYPAREKGFCGWYEPSMGDLMSPIPTVFFREPSFLPYDNLMVPVPTDYHGYLRYKFGDYMKIPPEDARVPKHGQGGDSPWKFGPTGVDVRRR